MNTLSYPYPVAPHPRVRLTLGLSLALHGAVLAGWQPFTITPPRMAAFEPINVVLVGDPAPRLTAHPIRTPNPLTRTHAGPAESSTAAPLPAQPGSGNDTEPEQPQVVARSDVASLNNPKPPYPLAARRLGLQGRVLLSAHVHASGVCAEVKLKESSGHALLDEAALGSVRRWRFIPARRGDRPVDSWVDVPVSFRLESQARLAL